MLFVLIIGELMASDFVKAHRYIIMDTFMSRILATPVVSNTTISSQQVFLDGTFQVTSTVFDSCAAVFDMWQTGTGGAIFVQNGYLTVKDCTFSKNVATYAGAVMTVNTPSTIYDSKFIENVATSDVGALWSLTIEDQMEMPRYYLTITGGNFTKNSAANHCGALCSNFTHPTVQYCHFHSNQAGLSAGALGLIGFASAIVTGTDFQDNSCKTDGEFASPAVWVQGALSRNTFTVNFENTFFKSNLVNGKQKAHVVTYEEVKLIFRGYTCFDVASDSAFSAVKGEAIYDTQTIKYDVDSMDECKAGFPTDTFTASDIFTPTKAPTSTKTNPSETHSPGESYPQTDPPESQPSASSFESMTSESESPSESQSQSTSPSEQEEESDLNVPALAGSLLGLLLLIIIIIVIVCCCCKKGCCPCCGCCKLCCNCFKCCCCCNKRCCRRKKRKHPDTDIRAPMLVVPRDPQHDDSFVIFVNPRCGPEDIHESSDEDLKPDIKHEETL